MATEDSKLCECLDPRYYDYEFSDAMFDKMKEMESILKAKVQNFSDHRTKTSLNVLKHRIFLTTFSFICFVDCEG